MLRLPRATTVVDNQSESGIGNNLLWDSLEHALKECLRSCPQASTSLCTSLFQDCDVVSRICPTQELGGWCMIALLLT